MSAPHLSNSGKYITARTCGISSAVAAGAGDATAVTGATVDTRGFYSGKVLLSYKTTLTDTKTLAHAVAYQESDDGSNWDTAVAIQASTVSLTGSSSTDALGVLEFPLDFGGKAGGTASATQTLGKRYIRINFTPDLSHTGTDTAISSAVLILGGPETIPAAYPAV